MSDWRDLPAGPELDALVAERVMGWTNCHIGPTYRKAMGIPPEMLAKQPPDRTINFPCHHYSQAIGCAWEVVETMERRGLRLCLEHQVQSWVAFFATDDRTPYDDDSILQEADTAPLSICRASLAALEVANG